MHQFKPLRFKMYQYICYYLPIYLLTIKESMLYYKVRDAIFGKRKMLFSEPFRLGSFVFFSLEPFMDTSK